MHAFVFPGQGSQERGMGGRLFDRPEYTAVEHDIDRLLGYSVREVCAAGPESLLNDTRYTQPCLFVVNALHFFDALATHGRPEAVAGHSLGEYNALMAAGAFDLLTGVRLVAKRGELMGRAARGAMAAVLRMRSEDVARILERNGPGDLAIANYNAEQQTVIAGPAAAVDEAVTIFERSGASCVRLRVSAAFHSRSMTDAADEFARFLETFAFRAMTLPVVSNVTAQFYPMDGHAITIASLLRRQITAPVRWLQTVQYLRAVGVASFIEVGPGVVLTRLCQQIATRPSAEAVPCDGRVSGALSYADHQAT